MILQDLGQVIVIQGDHRLDVVGKQLINEVVVVLHPGCIHAGSGAIRHDAWPRNRETVMCHLQSINNNTTPLQGK